MVNFRRGLFRLWLVFSVIFAVSVFIFSFNDIYSEFKNEWQSMHPPADFVLLIPITSAEARGEKKDYDCQAADSSVDNINAMFGDKTPTICWYPLPKFRKLYPEYNNLSDEDLDKAMYQKVGSPLKDFKPWTIFFSKIAIALGIPLLIFAFGKSLIWIIQGFLNNKTDTKASF